MPSLYLFHRRTLLAGDDLQLPSLAWGSLCVFQLFLCIPYLLYYTIELILSPAIDGADDDDFNNVHNWLGTVDISAQYTSYHERRTLDIDDYITSMEKRMPNMQSSVCAQATTGFTDMKFPYLVLAYLIGMSGYCGYSLWYEQRIFHLSSLGTPTMNLELRAPLGGLIESKMTYLAGVNFMLLVYGLTSSLRFIGKYIQCFPTFWWIVWFVLIATQGLQFIFAFTTFISLWKATPVSETCNADINAESTGAANPDFYHRHVDHLHNHNNAEVAEEMWRSRCEGCCQILAVSTCFLFGGQSIVSHASEGGGEKFYGDIARALADYFADFGEVAEQRGLDVVPSDVALGFVVLRRIQAQRKLLARREVLQQTGNGYGSAARDVSLPIEILNRTVLLFRRGSKRPTEPNAIETDPSNSYSADEVISDNLGSQADRSQTEERYQSFSRTVLSPANPSDVAVLEEGARFARHQLAIYTWILYYYMFPCTATFRLIGQSIKEKLSCRTNNTNGGSNVRYERCSSSSPINTPCDIDLSSGNEPMSAQESTKGATVGDNFLRIHERTMMAHAGLDRSDIAYASFETGFYETPYCIVIDRKWKSVVVSIRGSLTLEDCVVDVLLDPSPLDALGDKYGFAGEGQYCHGGVLECTQWLHSDLMRNNILETLLMGDNAQCRGYALRIVGHSLGGGIGVILSLMLRQTYPNLRCIAYSPPGGLLTHDLATSCSEFVNTFILDSDIVPRLSLDNMERLRDEVLHLIPRVKLSKYDIAKRIFWHGLCGEVELGDLDYLIQQNDDMLYPPDYVLDSEFMRQLQRFDSMQQGRRSNRGVSRSIALFPPGRIVHLSKTGQSKACVHGILACISCGASNAGSEYTPIRKENDDFNEIEISPTLWTDHFPNRVCIEIERVAERFGIDTSLGSPRSQFTSDDLPAVV